MLSPGVWGSPFPSVSMHAMRICYLCTNFEFLTFTWARSSVVDILEYSLNSLRLGTSRLATCKKIHLLVWSWGAEGRVLGAQAHTKISEKILQWAGTHKVLAGKLSGNGNFRWFAYQFISMSKVLTSWYTCYEPMTEWRTRTCTNTCQLQRMCMYRLPYYPLILASLKNHVCCVQLYILVPMLSKRAPTNVFLERTPCVLYVLVYTSTVSTLCARAHTHTHTHTIYDRYRGGKQWKC